MGICVSHKNVTGKYRKNNTNSSVKTNTKIENYSDKKNKKKNSKEMKNNEFDDFEIISNISKKIERKERKK